MSNAPVSALHKEVGNYLRTRYPQARIEGWPESEANLGHMLGMKEMNLRLDFLVTLEDSRSFAVEVQSNLHDERGEKAWNGGRDEHLKRMARDKTKKGLCLELGLYVVYVWSFGSIENQIDDAELCASSIVRKDMKNERVAERPIQTSTDWKPRKMESKGSFGSGQKMTGGSSFTRKGK